MRFANVFQLGVKELRGLLRNTMLLVLIVFAFTIQIYTASRAVPETLNRAAIAIVDEDQSAISSRIVTAFYPPYFVPPKLISQPEMDSRMNAGIDTFALDIPPTSSATFSRAGLQPFSSTSTRHGCRRLSPVAAICSRSCRERSTSSSPITGRGRGFRWRSTCAPASTPN